MYLSLETCAYKSLVFFQFYNEFEEEPTIDFPIYGNMEGKIIEIVSFLQVK